MSFLALSPFDIYLSLVVVCNTSTLFGGDHSTFEIIGYGTNANGASGPFTDTIDGQLNSTRNRTKPTFTFELDLKKPVFTSDDNVGSGGGLHLL